MVTVEHTRGICMINVKMLMAAMVLGATLASPAVTQAATLRDHIQAVSSQLDDIGQSEPPRSTKRSYDIYQSGQYVGSILIQISACSCSANTTAARGSTAPRRLPKSPGPAPGAFSSAR